MNLPRLGLYEGPAPVVHPENETFWHGLAQGRLLLQRCAGCGQLRFPVAPVCWRCAELEHAWIEVSPTGQVSAAVTVERATGNQVWAAQTPFVTALVEMDCGLRLPGRVLRTEGARPERGLSVAACHLDAGEGIGVLCFVPTGVLA